MRMRKRAGFTLVEIAIVLVIVGLLLGSVLKGQEIINSAKAKAVINEFNNVATMKAAYEDRFRFLPGDDPAVAIHLDSQAVTATSGGTVGNGRIEGAWNSNIPTDESVLFWQHLRLANLATGDTAAPPSSAPAFAQWAPKNVEGGRIGISSTRPAGLPTAIRGRFFICEDNLDGRIAQQVDTALDDGIGTTGSVGVFADSTSNAGVQPPVEGTSYTVCRGI